MQIEIPIKLPSLNEYINVCRRNRYQAAAYKKNIEDQIGFYLIGVPRFEKPIEITFHWIESNKRRDLDNIAFGKKFILDAMVKFGKLKDDNRKCVTGFKDEFSYGNEAMVILDIEEAKNE